MTLAVVCGLLSSTVEAQNNVTVRGKLKGSNGYSVLLVQQSGGVHSTKITSSNGFFKINKIPRGGLIGASLHLVDPSGNYSGPVLLSKKGTQGAITLKGSPNRRSLELGNLTRKSGYARTKKNVKSVILDPARITLSNTGAPTGAGRLGLAAETSSSVFNLTSSKEVAGVGILTVADPGGDQDSDGIVNAFDADDNGDGVPDYADPISATSTASENPFTTLYLGMAQTKNVNVTGELSDEEIDAIVGGENIFNLILFFDVSSGDLEGATQGYVVCDNSLPYCRPASAGGSSSIYSGVSESDPDVRNQTWSDYDPIGAGYPNLEPIRDGNVLAASIQPRVGASEFRPGDVLRVVFRNSDEEEIGTKVMTIPPYFITVPALASYDVGGGEVAVDYTSDPIPGQSEGSPIVLPDGEELTVSFWRPQRQSVGSESGAFKDIGHLNYGIVLSTDSAEFGCAGHYSALSSTLTDNTVGDPEEDEFNFWPLRDSSDDQDPDEERMLSFTVDLAACLAENSAPTDTYSVSLTAAGEELSGGANRAAQLLYVDVQ